MKRNILVTGGTGFVGQELISQLSALPDIQVFLACRDPIHSSDIVPNVSCVFYDLSQPDNLQQLPSNIDVVIHLAARVHMFGNQDPSVYSLENTEATARLATWAVRHKVNRFIFLSTIKVLGEFTEPRTKFTINSRFNPQDPYACSKREAEQQIKGIMANSGTSYTIIRPPLVYGTTDKGNFPKLIKMIASGVPLPFSGSSNKRDMVYVANLASLIVHAISSDKAKNQTFLVSDGEALMMSELIKTIALNIKSSGWIFYLPKSVFWLGLMLLGKKSIYERLFKSLEVDSARVQQMLGWKPPFNTQEACAKTVKEIIHAK